MAKESHDSDNIPSERRRNKFFLFTNLKQTGLAAEGFVTPTSMEVAQHVVTCDCQVSQNQLKLECPDQTWECGIIKRYGYKAI